MRINLTEYFSKYLYRNTKNNLFRFRIMIIQKNIIIFVTWHSGKGFSPLPCIFCKDKVKFRLSEKNSGYTKPTTIRYKSKTDKRQDIHSRYSPPQIHNPDSRGMGAPAFHPLPHQL